MLDVVLSNPVLLSVILAGIVLIIVGTFFSNKFGDYISLIGFIPLPTFIVLAFIYNASFQAVLVVSLIYALSILCSLLFKLRRKAK